MKNQTSGQTSPTTKEQVLASVNSTTEFDQISGRFFQLPPTVNNCKHGVDVFNCYDGCYDEMKNGTVN